MKKLIIKVKFGGIGDHLLYSPIPRLAKTIHKFDYVYISNFSEYANPQTKKLIWEYNPYIDGFIDEDAPTPSFGKIKTTENLIDAVINFVGLPHDGINFREPEIYYTPKIIEKLIQCNIYDPNYKNTMPQPSINSILNYFNTNKIHIHYQMKPLFNNVALPNVLELNTLNLEELCDIIHSCNNFYSLLSGVATLSAALKKPTTVFHHIKANKMFLHSKTHKYIQI